MRISSLIREEEGLSMSEETALISEEALFPHPKTKIFWYWLYVRDPKVVRKGSSGMTLKIQGGDLSLN